MTHDLDIASRTLLIAYDPTTGRRPDIQRLGPIVRAVGLADLLRTESVLDGGDTLRSQGEAPQSPPMLTLWRDCAGEVSWRAAVGKNGRVVIHECEQALAEAGLVTLTTRRFGPFRSRSARPTAAGEGLAEQWRQHIRAELASDAPPASFAALGFGLQEFQLAKVLGRGRAGEGLDSALPAGLAAAIRRVARDLKTTVAMA